MLLKTWPTDSPSIYLALAAIVGIALVIRSVVKGMEKNKGKDQQDSDHHLL